MMGDAARAALVTGAGARLGKAMALAFAADGYAVAVHYNASGEAAGAVVREIEAAGGQAVAIGRDLADPGAAGAVVEDAAAALGPLSVLANSASLFGPDSLKTLDMASWRALTDINGAAPVMLMQAFANQPEIPDGASILNLLDAQLSHPNPNFFSYFCGKAILEMATRLAALELAPAIRVNGVAPGLVLRSGNQTDESFARRQTLTPLGAGLGADDIVQAALYLTAARHVTGQVIAVDSGQALYGFGNADVKPA